jgi:2-methylcitrate dehydratase PrpD
VKYPLGHYKNRMSDSEIESKFRMLATGVLPLDQIEKIIEAVWHLDEFEDSREFAFLLGRKQK